MNNQPSINIKSIQAFENISNSKIKELIDSSELIKYQMGYPILKEDNIPNRILITLSGEARIFNVNSTEKELLSSSILKPFSFIGLSSLLRAQGCEQVKASTDIVALSIPDNLLLKLYSEELEFRNWCNSNLQISEVYDIAYYLAGNNPRSNFQLDDFIEVLSTKIKVKIINNNSSIQIDKDLIYIIGSANVNNKIIGELITKNELLTIRGNLPARLYTLPKEIYEKLCNSNNEVIDNIKNPIVDPSIIENAKPGPESFDKSIENLGQYSPKKSFKLIKANGSMKESLACLQMLASEFNLPFRSDSIEKILIDSIERGKKPNIQMLGGITSVMGLHSSLAKLDPSVANRLPKSSLISFKESFAIVKDSNSQFLELASPVEGIIRIKPEDFKQTFSKGFIELLLVDKNETTPESKFGIKWLLPVINKYRNSLIQVLLASFVVQLLGLANPLMMQVIIDKVISQRSLDTLQILGAALIVVTVLGGVISSLRTFLFAETTNRIDTRLGAEVIDHLLRLPLNYFDRRPVGELGSRVAELEKIRNFLTGQALTTILDAAFSLIYIIVMVLYSWLLTLIALGVVPIQIFITIIGAPLIRKQIRDIARENAKTQSHLVEVLTGIQTVKAQNVENVSRWKWQDLYGYYISKSFQKTITGTALGETSQVLQQLSQLLVLWVGATLVLNGQLSLGQLIAFRIISGYVTQPLLRLSQIWQNIQELRVSFERLADIIDTPEESSELDKQKIPLPSLEGLVEFEDVSFKFNPGQPNVLKNINLKIKPGQFVGIVGQSGSGKSTLVKLLPRLYKPQSGRLIIDGYNIDKVELYSLRRQIGIVPQEPLLFAGSINENIALTDPEVASDEIVQASKVASAHDFIMNLEDGYSTNVGERGAGLSGGQKQRIAIARTLLSKPKLLIMDEATSALDYQTERKVCEGLRNSCKNSTVFFITHRLSTVKNADLIVMLDKGSIVEQGTHQELLELKGRYYALYRQQESS